MDTFIKQQQEILHDIELKLNGKTVFFDGDTDPITALILHKVIRKIDKNERLFLILESPGGSIDSAAKIVHMCKEYFNELNVIVPYYAKSAASLIAIAADNLYIGKCGEIGPIDPYVQHPVGNYRFPALAIKDAIEVIEETKDPYVKMGLTDKIDPYLMGSYKRTLREARQYIEKANLIKTASNKEKVISELTETYISHGYPIDRKACLKIGIKFSDLDNEIFSTIYDFMENHLEFNLESEVPIKLLILSDKLKEVKFSKKTELSKQSEGKKSSIKDKAIKIKKSHKGKT